MVIRWVLTGARTDVVGSDCEEETEIGRICGDRSRGVGSDKDDGVGFVGVVWEMEMEV